MEKEKAKCTSANKLHSPEKFQNVTDCATFCHKSSYSFSFGTTEFGGSDSCDSDGKCDCACELSADENGECDLIEDENYVFITYKRGE